MMKTFSTHTIAPEHAGLTVESYLKQILFYSGRKLQKLTRLKGIRLNGKTAFLQRKLQSADRLQVLQLVDTDFGVRPQSGEISILYEDNDLLVVNKPAAQLVHPTGQTTNGTLANYLASYLQQNKILAAVRPIHRLDRDTSGCVIFAKNSRSQLLLEQQLKSGLLKRTYWALVQGVIEPAAGTITAPIGPHPSLPNRRAITAHGQSAITHYKTLRTFANAALLELRLETGRTHQIRLHLAHSGYPILGDGMYGVRSALIARQALHAAAVSFKHPEEEREITVTAPLPQDFASALQQLAELP